MFSSLKFRSTFPPPEQQALTSQSKFYKSLSLTDLNDDFFRDCLENNSPFSQRKQSPLKREIWYDVPLTDPSIKELLQPSSRAEAEETTSTIPTKFNLTKIISVQSLKDPIFSFVRKCKILNKGEMQENLIKKDSRTTTNYDKQMKKCNKVKKVSISSDKCELIDGSSADDVGDYARRRKSARSYSVPDSDSEVLRVSWKFKDESADDQSGDPFKPTVDITKRRSICPKLYVDDREQTDGINICPTREVDTIKDDVTSTSNHDGNVLELITDLKKDFYSKREEDSGREYSIGSPANENGDCSLLLKDNKLSDEHDLAVKSTKNQDYITEVIDRIEKCLIKHFDPNIYLSETIECFNIDDDSVDKIRDRSKVGVRSSLPFTASSSSTTSGVSSSGASDTQSQGSGGTDSKSDSLTPEGSRKVGSQGRVSSVQSVSGSVISSRMSKVVEVSKIAGDRETTALRQEVETLRAEITKARQTILHMQERDGKRKERYGDRSCIDRLGKLSGTSGSRVENVNLGDRRPTSLVRRYAHLYAQTRLDTFDALDSLPDLRAADELKAKLLFSVVVLAFRSVTTTATLLREEIRRILQMMPPPSYGGGDGAMVDTDPSSRSVELALSSYIASSVDTYDLTKNVDEVCEQIWATLYDYPSLKMSEALLQYTKDCVRISWGLINQNPPYLLEYETRTFQKELHVRFHTANPNSDVIKTYLWPSLVEGPGGPCVHQGIVMT